jgi:hypothetical protein
MSLPLSRLSPKDAVMADAEAQVTLTCVDEGARCIGRPYSYSPVIGARLVLARSRRSVDGFSLSDRKTVRCSQTRPNRNHHCVLVFQYAAWDATRRPACFPAKCRINLVVDAHHLNARPGNVVVIGADLPDGSIEEDKGRLAAVISSTDRDQRVGTRERRAHSIPMSEEGGGGLRVSYSLRLPPLRRGDVIEASALQVADISHLPYAAWIGTHMILATRPRATQPRGVAKRIAPFGATLTESNGSNCTLAESGFQTPCRSRKAGLTTIRRSPVDSRNRPVPIYLNLVTRSFPKLTHAQEGDRALVRREGWVRASIFHR